MDNVPWTLALKTEAIMDLSCCGKTREFRRKPVETSPAMIGVEELITLGELTKQAWEKMIDLAMEPEKPGRYRESARLEHADSCTMCGKMCTVRNMNRVLEAKDAQLND